MSNNNITVIDMERMENGYRTPENQMIERSASPPLLIRRDIERVSGRVSPVSLEWVFEVVVLPEPA
jgi:hypothetical protein